MKKLSWVRLVEIYNVMVKRHLDNEIKMTTEELWGNMIFHIFK